MENIILKETRLQNVNRSVEIWKPAEQHKPNKNMNPNTFIKTKFRKQNNKVHLFDIYQLLMFDDARMIFLY